jgi:hypothetical protein
MVDAKNQYALVSRETFYLVPRRDASLKVSGGTPLPRSLNSQPSTIIRLL